MSNGRIAILCPSRGRRPELDRLLTSFDATHTGLADIFVRNGETDPTLAEYTDLKHPYVTRITGTDEGFAQWPDAGHCFAMQDLWQRNPGYSVYSIMEDDMTFTERGWDEALLRAFDAFPNHVGVVHWTVTGGPAYQIAVSDTWTNALGYFQYPPLGEAGYHGLLALAGKRVVPGPKIHHWCVQTRWAHREPLWKIDLQRLAEWRHSADFQAQLDKLAQAEMEGART